MKRLKDIPRYGPPGRSEIYVCIEHGEDESYVSRAWTKLEDMKEDLRGDLEDLTDYGHDFEGYPDGLQWQEAIDRWDGKESLQLSTKEDGVVWFVVQKTKLD